MSLFDDTPLEIGIKYYDKTIIGWDADAQKYLVASPCFKNDLWLSKEKVERDYGSSLLDGVEFRQATPGNSYNTRYFRVNTN